MFRIPVIEYNTRRIIIGLLFLIAVLSIQSTGVMAYTACDPIRTQGYASPNPVSVSILLADYQDIDGDMLKDDIITKFRVTVDRRACCFDLSYAYCQLRLPSGTTYIVALMITGQYSTVTITLGWINLASTSGWYRFTVNAEVFDYLRGVSLWGYDSVDFDPPTEGSPGPPLVKVLSAAFT